MDMTTILSAFVFIIIINGTFSYKNEQDGLPKILDIIPKNATVGIGENANFDCYFKSKSPSIIQWLKNSQMDNADHHIFGLIDSWSYYKIIQTYHEFRVNNTIHSHRLSLKNVQSTDAGAYTCLVSNIRGYNYNITYLYVEIKAFNWKIFLLHLLEESTIIFLFIPVFSVIIVFIFSLFIIHRTKSTSPQNLKKKYVSSYVQTLPCSKDNSLIPYVRNIKPSENYSSLQDSRGTYRSRSLLSTEITSDISFKIS